MDAIKQVFATGGARGVHVSGEYVLHVGKEKGLGLFSTTKVYSKLITTPTSTNKEPFEARVIEGRAEVLFEKPVNLAGYKSVYVIDSTGKGRLGHGWVKIDQFANGRAETKREDDDDFILQTYRSITDATPLAINIHELIRDTDLAGQGAKLTSWAGVIAGPVEADRALKNYRHAKSIGDREGMRLAVTAFARGVIETGASAVTGSGRILSLTSASVTGKIAQVASRVIGIISTVLGSLVYSLVGVLCGMTLRKELAFRSGLFQAEKEGRAFAFLKEMISLKKEDFDLVGNAFNFKNESEFYNAISVPVILSEEERAILTGEDQKKIAALLESSIRSLKGKSYQNAPDWDSVAMNLAAKASKMLAMKKLMKKTEFIRVAGSETYQAVVSGNEALAVEKAKLVSRKKVIIDTFVLFAVAIGVLSFILASIFTAGAPLIAALVIMLVSNLILTVIDFKEFVEGIKEMTRPLSVKAKVLYFVLLALAIASTVVGAVFSGGGLLLIVILIAGIAMIASQVGGFIYLYKKQRERELAKEAELKKAV